MGHIYNIADKRKVMRILLSVCIYVHFVLMFLGGYSTMSISALKNSLLITNMPKERAGHELVLTKKF